MINIAKTGIHTKRQVFFKFILLLLLLLGYFGYISIKYDVATGSLTAILTWSFFVLCTPVADAGFLLDFPLRLLFGIRMVISEVVVWGLAISVNVFGLLFFSQYYQTTQLTKLLQAVLTHPIPYWSIIILSALGTFLSIRFSDELMDIVHHKDRHFFHRHAFKHELILIIFFIFIFVGYYNLLSTLGIELNE